MNILGLSCHYHDAAAALVCDGKVVAAAQEDRARCSITSIPTRVHNQQLGIEKMPAVGLRRSMSSIGSHNYGLVTGEDLSRQSVCKAEVYAASRARQCESIEI